MVVDTGAAQIMHLGDAFNPVTQMQAMQHGCSLRHSRDGAFHRFPYLFQLLIAEGIIVVFWHPFILARSLASFETLH